MHISYKVQNGKQKQKVKNILLKKDTILWQFRKELGLIVDVPKATSIEGF